MLAYPGNLIKEFSTFTGFKCHVFSNAKRTEKKEIISNTAKRSKPLRKEAENIPIITYTEKMSLEM